MNAKTARPKKQRNIRAKNRKIAKNDDFLGLEERLLPGEEVIVRSRISNGIYWKSIAVLIIALLFAVFVFVELGVILAVFAMALFTAATLKKEVLMLVVTNKRIFVRYGLLQVDVVDIHFDKIESVELERMITGYLMGYANVVILGTGSRFIVIPYIANSIEIRRAFNEQTLLNKPPSAPVSPPETNATIPAAPGTVQPAPPESPGKTQKSKDGSVKGSGFVMKD